MKITNSKLSKELLLKKILEKQSLEAKYGAEASVLCKEYVVKYSPIKRGDFVRIILFGGDIRYGIVGLIKFDTSLGFVYNMSPVNKNKKETKRKAFYRYHTQSGIIGNSEVKDIIKIK